MRSHVMLGLVTAALAAGAGWQPLGPFGGSAAIVRVDRHHSHTLLAATSNARIFRSEDDGESWNPLPFPAELRATLHAFALDEHNPGVYLVGLSSDTAEYSGIMRTVDNGLTWDRIPNPELRAVWSIAILKEDSRVIAAGTEDGLLLTRDRGKTWERVTPRDDSEMQPVVSVTFDPWDSKTLYVGTPHLAWKTSDRGEMWQSIRDGMLDDSDVFSILADDRTRDRIFAATCGGIYRSHDGGGDWTKLREAKGASFRTYHISQNPFQPSVLLAGTSLGLVKSMDGGDTWRRLTAQSTRWIEFDPERPNLVFIATDEAGLFRSDDAGETLRSINQGFVNRQFVTFTDAQNALYVATLTASGTSILRHSDSEPEWQEPSGPVLRSIQAEMLAPSKVLDEIPPQVLDDLRIHDVVVTDRGELLAASSRGLARSVDAGMTWKLVPGSLDGTTVSALCGHPTRPGVFFASRFGELFRSLDYGRNWTPLAASPEHPNDFIALLVPPGRSDWIFALSRSRGVFGMALPLE
ncbi:MAG: WD40/YVTN/BNR-like repeat-containing protein [Bryobacteraceae bacterium]